MFIIIRFLLYTLPLLIFGLFEFVRNYPTSKVILGVAIFIVVWLFGVVWYLIRHSVRKQSNYMALAELVNYFITPVLLVLSSLLFLVFFNDPIFYRLVAGVIAFLSFLFLESVFIYLYYPQKYVLSSMENVSSYLNILISFFLYSGYYGLTVFLHIRSKWLFVLLIFLNVILLLQTFFINKLKFKTVWLPMLLSIVIFGELVWAVQYLTFTFLVKGVIVSLVYYTISGLLRYYFLQSYNKKILWRHISVVAIIMFFLLFTAQWL